MPAAYHSGMASAQPQPDPVAGLVPQRHTVMLQKAMPTSVLEAPGPDAPGEQRPPLLLLHGWMATAALNWFGALRALSGQWRVVAPDLRGHGRFGHKAPRFTVDGCADDQAALIREMALPPVVVVGYSMGGAVAQVLARRHPKLVAGIVLCATAPSFAELTWLRPGVKVAGRALGDLCRIFPGTARTVLHRRIGLYASAGEAGGANHSDWALQERAGASLASLIEAGAALNAFDSRSWLPQLDVPTAVLVTTEDHRVAPWRQDMLTALIPGAKRFPLKAGHDAVVAKSGLFFTELHRACTAITAVGAS